VFRPLETITVEFIRLYKQDLSVGRATLTLLMRREQFSSINSSVLEHSSRVRLGAHLRLYSVTVPSEVLITALKVARTLLTNDFCVLANKLQEQPRILE